MAQNLVESLDEFERRPSLVSSQHCVTAETLRTGR